MSSRRIYRWGIFIFGLVVSMRGRTRLIALRQRTELSNRQFAETPLSRIGLKQTLLAAVGVVLLIAGFYLWGAQVVGIGLAAMVPVS